MSDKVLNSIDNRDTSPIEGKFEDLKNGIFLLKKNSIAFVELEPHFRLPEYIACSFNLKVKTVYKGLLLGTGPIVDPGYTGKLFFPLHNLTNNDYQIDLKKSIISMEFTKISFNKNWTKKEIDTSDGLNIYDKGEYKKFDDKGKKKSEQKTLRDYLQEANPYSPIFSSLSDVHRYKTELDNVYKKTNGIANKINLAVLITIIATLLTSSGLLLSFYMVHSKTIEQIEASNKILLRYDSTKDEVKYDSLKKQYNRLDKEMSSLRGDLQKLEENKKGNKKKPLQ
jgi:hypothetical protein